MIRGADAFQVMIDQAKHQVEVWYKCVGDGRKWLTTNPIDSYSDPEWRIEIWVLEGSPAKGNVVADWGNRCVKAQCFSRSKTYRQGVW